MWIPIIRTLYIYVNKDVSVSGYFSKPKGVGEQKCLGNSDLNENKKMERPLVNTLVHLRFPENTQKFLIAKRYSSFAKSAVLHGANWI